MSQPVVARVALAAGARRQKLTTYDNIVTTRSEHNVFFGGVMEPHGPGVAGDNRRVVSTRS